MQSWITDFMEQFGYIGVFLMIALENVFPPIPSEVILPFGGFMTTYTNLTVPRSYFSINSRFSRRCRDLVWNWIVA